MPTVDDCNFIYFHTHEDNGFLSVSEFGILPFQPQRMFYVYDVKKIETRGNHAHYKTKQILLCLKGECGVGLFDGKKTRDVRLYNPTEALYIPEMIWDTQIYSKDALLLVLASTPYDKSDYITDIEEYKRIVNEQK